jgi:hypothetical protein
VGRFATVTVLHELSKADLRAILMEGIAGPPAKPRVDLELRRESLAGLPPRPRAVLAPVAKDAVQPAGVTDTRGWTEAAMWNSVETIKDSHLDWKNTTGSARKWGETFENENRHRPVLVHRLVEELRNRKATIAEFFRAYVYSYTDDIQANLHYLDYQRLKDAPAKAGAEA